MTARQPRTRGIVGLVILAIIKILVLVSIADSMISASSYKGTTPGKLSIAEAAIVTGAWSQVIAYSCVLLALNAVVIGFAICNRLTALHRAIIYAAEKSG